MKIFINFTNLFSINKNVRKEGEREKKRERDRDNKFSFLSNI